MLQGAELVGCYPKVLKGVLFTGLLVIGSSFLGVLFLDFLYLIPRSSSLDPRFWVPVFGGFGPGSSFLLGVKVS